MIPPREWATKIIGRALSEAEILMAARLFSNVAEY